MSRTNPTELPLYNHLRNSILSQATIMNPYPYRTLDLITYPTFDGKWDVRVVALKRWPHEAQVLAHVDDSFSEMTAMQEMLHFLQRGSRRMFGGRGTGNVFGFADDTESGFGDTACEFVNLQSGNGNPRGWAEGPQRGQGIPVHNMPLTRRNTHSEWADVARFRGIDRDGAVPVLPGGYRADGRDARAGGLQREHQEQHIPRHHGRISPGDGIRVSGHSFYESFIRGRNELAE